MRKQRVLVVVGLALVAIALLTGSSGASCETDASVASYNVSNAADQFEIFRRVVFYNGITDQYILVVEGYCSITVDTTDSQLELMVKVGPDQYLKHFLGLSDNVTYFAEQIEPARVSDAQYRVIFKPSVIIPALELDRKDKVPESGSKK